MNDSPQDSFFVSESLKDILDQEALIESSMELLAKNQNEIELLGSFMSIDMKHSSMSLEVSSKVAKVLLFNTENTYTFPFMEHVWLLNSEGMRLEQRESGKFKATLNIEGKK